MKPTIIPAIFRAKDEMSAKVAKMQAGVVGFSEKFKAAGQTAFSVGRKAAIAGAIIAAPLVLAAKAAVDFEEKMSDVSKTTGMQGNKLQKFGDELLSMSTKTRTSIDDLASIAEIGGQLGIAEKDLLAFTDSANKFNIALGADFSGGVEEAVSTVGKIKTLFKETRDLNIAEAISKTGSAINELGAVGAGTSANISDFTLRMGALPDALKMSAQQTLALGTFLEELGIDAQIGAGGMANLLLVAGREVGGFAKQMNITAKQAKELLANDPSEFASRFAKTFKGMAPDKMALALQNLKLGSQETIKVIGALSADQENQATGLARLATLQNVANKAFAENNSLKAEAAKKEQTAAAQMAKLKNNMQALAITVGSALLPVINDLVAGIMPYIEAAANWIKNNKGLTATIVKVAAGAAALSFAISGISFAIGVYQKAAVIARAATLAMNSAMLVSPLGLMIAGIAVLTIGVYALSKAFTSVSNSQKLNAEVQSRVLDKTIDQRVEVEMLFNSLRKTKVGTEEYTSILKQIDSISPGLTNKYNLQAGALNNINRAEKELLANIKKRAEAEVRMEMFKETVRQRIKTEQDLQKNKAKGDGGFFDVVNPSMVHAQEKSIGLDKAKEAALSRQIMFDQQNSGSSATPVAANPEGAKASKTKVEFEFTGLPEWMKPVVKTSGGGGSMPVMGKNK